MNFLATVNKCEYIVESESIRDVIKILLDEFIIPSGYEKNIEDDIEIKIRCNLHRVLKQEK
jgi:hypothetical protein